MKWLLGVISAVSLTLVVLYVAIHIPTFSLQTYANHYHSHNTANIIQISEQELMMVTERLVGYMRGTYPDILIYATVAGEYRRFFTDREIYHMVDVLLLFNLGRILRNVSIVAVALTWLYAYKKSYITHFAKAYFYTGIAVLLYCALLAWLFATNFVLHFHIFHEIFFFFDQEQLWILDPSVDMLLNMVPYEFFINIATTIGIIFASAITAITLTAGAYTLKMKGIKNGDIS